MTDIAKCVCGKSASTVTHGGYWFTRCDCGWSGPVANTDAEAVAAWNPVMSSVGLLSEVRNVVATFADDDGDDEDPVFTEEELALDAIQSLQHMLTAAGFDIESEEA